MWSVFLGLFLIAHAFVHAVWRTYGPKTSWVLTNMGEPGLRALSTWLFVAATIGFTLSGLALLFHWAWWRPVAVVFSVVSLALFVFFWNRGLIVGAAIDVAILVALLWFRWPPASLLNARVLRPIGG